MKMNKIEQYLENNWDKCIRESRFDEGTLLGLPYPYTVPSVEAFNEIYYWDTYFTNVGLLNSGRAMLAKQNTDNILYLVDKYGFMPNGSRTYYLTRSQPPFLFAMVRDICDYYDDNVWLNGAYFALCKEYKFWMNERIAPNGLNRYSPNPDPDTFSELAEGFKSRTKTNPDTPEEELARHCLGTCESGWDMTPRWDFEAHNFNAADLNFLLFAMEKNMAYFAEKLGYSEDVAVWNTRAEKRLELMNKFMLDKNNLFLDYNFKTNRLSRIFSAASYYPLYAKAATPEQAAAAAENLRRLEAEFGILTCEKNDSGVLYQWDYPNGWACLQYIVMVGLNNYGYTDDAKRIAQKYVTLAEKVFDETGALWEKYNVVDGSINVSNEYKMPTMLGWSAGVYIAAQKFLKQ